LSQFPDKPYISEYYDDGAVRGRKPRDLSLISLVTIPACNRRTDGQTDGHDYGYIALHSIS